jgi:hypothetical protein
MRKNPRQPIFNFACNGCPWMVTGRCHGPSNHNAYLMQDETLVPCIDVERRGLFYEDLNNRLITTPQSSHQHKIVFPPFIASIKDGLRLPDNCSQYTFAIPLGKILNKSGSLRYKSIEAIRRRFGLHNASKVVLIGTGKDEKIEAMWKVSDAKRIWEGIAGIGFDWVTTPCFSVWTETPRAHQIWSQDRILQTHDILANLGVPCVPFLFPIEDVDFKVIAKWLNSHPDVTKVAVYGRYYKNSPDLEEFLNLLRKIQNLTDRALEFLVVGLAMADRILAIAQEFKASFVTGKPFHRAYAGEICKPDLTYVSSSVLRADLTTYNLKQTFDYCERLRNQFDLALRR